MIMAKELTETLRAFREQIEVSTEVNRRQLEENKLLRESLARATGGSESNLGGDAITTTPLRSGYSARLMGDLARRIPKFQFILDEPDAFRKWITRNELTITEDGKDLTEREKVRLLLGALEESTFHRYVDSQRDSGDIYEIAFKDTVASLNKVFGSHRSMMIRRQECLQISRSSGLFHDPLEYSNKISEAVLDAKLSTMTSDDWSVFLFLRGLDSPGDAAAKAYLMQWAEQSERKKETVTLAAIHDEWIRFIQLKQQTKTVAASSPKQQVGVNKVEKKNFRGDNKNKTDTTANKSDSHSNKEVTCFKCGERGHLAPQCPRSSGKKKKGRYWGKKGVQKTQCVRVDGLHENQNNVSKPTMRVNVDGQLLSFQVDTGSEITLINEQSWKDVGCPELEKVPHRISCANGTQMSVKGRALVSFELKGIQYTDYVYVRAKDDNLIGMSWISQSPGMCEGLAVMVQTVNTSVPKKEISRLESSLQHDYPQVFEETLGLCKKEKACVRTLPNVKAIFKKSRPVPYGSEKAVETELKRLEDMGVIERVSHTDWASPIVVVRKKNSDKIRICADFKSSGLNAALQDEHHPLPTSEDIFGKLKGSIFSQIDLRDAYLQLELDEEAQKLAVINTHLGLFKYRRMPFGLKPAPAVFQKVIDKLIAGIPGVAAYLDDVIVATDTMQEHEKILKKLFARFQEYGFKVSLEKCTFAKSEIKFLGFIVNGEGRKPDPEKTEVIRKMDSPKNQKQLASFLGAICFYSRFVPKLSELRGPLDRLMKQDVEWKWTPIEQNAFDKLKNAVADSTMLSHFKEDWKIMVAADASQYGIGGVLMHETPDGQEVPIAHFARSLTDTEKRYSQIEKEALALVYTVKKSHKFVFGRKFSLQTDHKPLLAIFGDSRDLPVHSQNRLVRWATTLLAYNFDISYISTAKFSKADWLSRMIQNYPRDEDDVVIAEIIEEDDDEDQFPTHLPVTSEDIRKSSETDGEISTVIELVSNNSWKPKPSSDIEKYWKRYKDRLKIIRNCLLIDDRVVVPKKLQEAVLTQLHEGHPGVIKMKQKARAYVFWRGLDSEVERAVLRCSNCQEQSKMPIVAPLNPWPAPKKPWSRIHVDFAGPVDGTYLLVAVDALTKYAEVKMTKTISAVATVDLMEEIFCVHGFPELIISDNGTQFTSSLFKNMCKTHGMQHSTTATYYPRSNGAAERMVDTLKRGLAKLKGTGSITRQLLTKFLYHYRNTPHAALNGMTPAEKHFNRKIRTNLSLLIPSAKNQQKVALSRYQASMKHQYDQHNAARAKCFQIGQKVYARIQRGNKSSWEFGVVRRRFGNVLYEVQIGERFHRSHANQLRLRFGDRSKEDMFEETVFPMFFGQAEGDGVENQLSGGPRVHREGLNSLQFSDPLQSSDVSSDFCDTFVGEEVFGRRVSGRSARAPVEVNFADDCDMMSDRRAAQESTTSNRSASANTTTATAINPANIKGPQSESSTNPSHSLRRSQRTKRAPNRFDPCTAPSQGRGKSRGSYHPDHPAARDRGVAPASNRFVLPNSSSKGGGVGKERGRPRWH
ncbi:hypothetical protein CRE_31410 [Caenorhabditis remanei]|uniref:RNA-directed DNA polymerase n=1 Tax=Caenorhabditis remanei TaxID=31234 RepID=E3N5T1_CAERE|nr:hypothetical protein CRE_31410 [Caenorhabditis remanei]